MPECNQQLRTVCNNKRRYHILHTSNLGCFATLRDPCNIQTTTTTTTTTKKSKKQSNKI